MAHKDFRRHCKGLSLSGIIPLGLIERTSPNDSEAVLVPTLGGTWATQQSSFLPDPGALVLDSNGAYRQANFGMLRPLGLLDQSAVMEALSTAAVPQQHGPDSNKMLKSLRMVTLDMDSHMALRKYGNGNLSEGVRAAARVADTALDNEWVELEETGRKRSFGVNLDDPTVDILKRIGFGNMSAGARRAAKLVGTAAQPTDKPTHQK